MRHLEMFTGVKICSIPFLEMKFPRKTLSPPAKQIRDLEVPAIKGWMSTKRQSNDLNYSEQNYVTAKLDAGVPHDIVQVGC